MKMFCILKILIFITLMIKSNGSSLTNGKLVIHHTELTTEIQDHAIITTIQAFDSSEDYNIVAKTITNALDLKYDGVWNCLLSNGSGNIFGFQLSYQSGSYIDFSIGQVHVTLFKTKSISKEFTEEEIISEAKLLLNSNTTVSYHSNLDKSIESKVVQTIVEILKLGSNTYKLLASKIQNAMSVKFADSWSVIIGRNDGFDFEHTSHPNGSLNLLIGKLRLLAYHIKCETCVEKASTQLQVIENARNSKGVVYQGRLLAHNNDDGLGMFNEANVYITEAIKTNNTYYEIAYSIAGNLKKKTVFNTLNTNWFVFVSDSANGVQYSPAGYAFIRIRYGPLEVAILKTTYM